MSTGQSRPTSRIEARNGRPQIVFDEKPISPATYCDPGPCSMSDRPVADPAWWVERQRDFMPSGVHNFHVINVHNYGTPGASRFWAGDGVYPDPSPDDDVFCVDRQAAALIDADPDVRIIVRTGDGFPQSWFEANPDHEQVVEWRGATRSQHSLASDKALAALCTFYSRLIEYCEARDWADRIFGYLSYPIGEGTTNWCNAGILFDTSPVMREKYRQFVRDKYGDEAALREAWADPDATFDAVETPTDVAWREKIKDLMHWVDSSHLQPERDYMDLQNKLWLNWYKTCCRIVRETLKDRPRFFGLDIGKIPLMGWQLALVMAGSGQGAEYINNIYGSGNVNIHELLDEPGLDALCTPADYTGRNVGYAFEPEGLTDSLVIRGKTMICENDCRTFAEPRGAGGPDDQGAFNTNAEVRAGFLRNSLMSLSRGFQDNWMVPGGAYYNDPDVQRHGVAPVTRLWDASVNWPHVETEHAIALVLDDTSARHEDMTCGFQNLAVIWQRMTGLAHAGIPYRIHLWSDLAAGIVPDYRCYVFPNLFELNDDRMGVLEKNVLRDGRMAIFGPGTGITDGTTLGAEWATRLLGVEMELISLEPTRRVICNGADPIAQALPAATVYGDGLAYGPLLIPTRGAVKRAGASMIGMATGFYRVNREGLFVRETDDYKLAWSVAVPIPGNVVRELARRGGCHVWCEDNDVVMASETLAALHSVKAGPRTLKFPAERRVWDLLTGEKLGVMSEVQMDITPPETRAFYFGDEDPFGGV